MPERLTPDEVLSAMVAEETDEDGSYLHDPYSHGLDLARQLLACREALREMARVHGVTMDFTIGRCAWHAKPGLVYADGPMGDGAYEDYIEWIEALDSVKFEWGEKARACLPEHQP